MPKSVKQAVLRSAPAQERPTEEETDLREHFLSLLRDQFRIKQGQGPSRWGMEARQFPKLDADIEKWQQSPLRKLPYMPPAPGFRTATLAPTAENRKSASGAPYARLMKIVPELQGVARNVTHASLSNTLSPSLANFPPEILNLGGEYKLHGPHAAEIYLNPLFRPNNFWVSESENGPAATWRKNLGYYAPTSYTDKAPIYGTHVLGHEYGHAVGLPHGKDMDTLEELLLKALQSRE